MNQEIYDLKRKVLDLQEACKEACKKEPVYVHFLNAIRKVLELLILLIVLFFPFNKIELKTDDGVYILGYNPISKAGIMLSLQSVNENEVIEPSNREDDIEEPELLYYRVDRKVQGFVDVTEMWIEDDERTRRVATIGGIYPFNETYKITSEEEFTVFEFTWNALTKNPGEKIFLDEIVL